MNDESESTCQERPALLRDRSFWGLTTTQFLGAFNDNLYKQLLLLLFVAVPGIDSNGKLTTTTSDQQSIAQFMFALPFILFSGWAGFLSDRASKPRVILLCKFAEIGIMTLGVLGFVAYGRAGLSPPVVIGMLAVIFCMGTHSAFFGPGKYGVLPELFRAHDLPAANGIVLMTTFLAIIFGSALAGLLKEHWHDRLWLAGCVCVGVAMFGVLTAWLIRHVPPAAPRLRFQWGMLGIPADVRRLIRRDVPLRNALAASTVFWLAAAIVPLAVNALGKLQLQVGDARTSYLVTIISLGIVIGSALAGLAGEWGGRAISRFGAWGMLITLAFLSVRGGTHDHLLGYGGSLGALVLLGICTGLFAVPLQVFLQARPPEDEKGRMIATMNLLNWIGILASAGIYAGAEWALRQLQQPPNSVFALTALILLPIAIFYRPISATQRGAPNVR